MMNTLLTNRFPQPSRRVSRSHHSRRALERTIRLAAWVIPKSQSTIVVHGLDESEDGALALVSALLARGITPVRLTNGATKSHFRIPGVIYRSKYALSGLWSFARAGVVFTSQALYGGMGGGPRQRTILLWHGEVVKPVGLLDDGRALTADIAPVCSAVAQAFRVAEFGLHPRQVPVVGSPRNDRLLSSERSEVRRRLGWPLDEAIWMWLPTYRRAVRGGRRADGSEAWQGLPYSRDALVALEHGLVDLGVTLVLKPHPLAEQRLPRQEHRRLSLLSQSSLEQLGVSLYEVLAAADGLVTDASSVWIDFLLLDKPMIFAFPDLEKYRADRGLNLEPYEDWAPGPVVAEVNEVIDNMKRVMRGEDIYAERRRRALRRFHRFSNDGSTARLLDLLDLLPRGPGTRAADASATPLTAPWLRLRRRRSANR